VTEPAPVLKRAPRAYPTILFRIPGWPASDPGRLMVWRVCFDGEEKAMRLLKRLNKRLAHEAEFVLSHMTARAASNLRNKGFNLREQRIRERLDAAAAS
jgi:hypothetical protein